MTQPDVSSDQLKAIQKRLQDMHYSVGLADGSWGPRTVGALATFQAVNDLTISGSLTDETVSLLLSDSAKSMPTSLLRKEMSETDVAEVVPGIKEAIFTRFMGKIAAAGSILVTFLAASAPLIGSAQEYLEPFKKYFEFLPSWAYPLSMTLVVFSLVYSTNSSIQTQISEFRTGNINGRDGIED